MTETIHALLMFILLAAAFILALRVAGWKLKRAVDGILVDLKRQKAFDRASAVQLHYGKRSPLQMGLRDYRPKALDLLIKQDIIRVFEGKYYLRDGENSALLRPGQK